jgi:hypothetical protein
MCGGMISFINSHPEYHTNMSMLIVIVFVLLAICPCPALSGGHNGNHGPGVHTDDKPSGMNGVGKNSGKADGGIDRWSMGNDRNSSINGGMGGGHMVIPQSCIVYAECIAFTCNGLVQTK